MPVKLSAQPTDASFHRHDKDPIELFVGTPHSVQVNGQSKPIVFQLDDDSGPAGFWVVKSQCRFKSNGAPILRELAGADLCAWFGLNTPQVGLVRIPLVPPATDESESGVAAKYIYTHDPGKLAFCSRFIPVPAASANCIGINKRRAERTVRDAVIMLAMDACIWNYDRTVGNPNALLMTRRVIPIDHDRAFFSIDKVDESGCPPDYTTPADPDGVLAHIAAPLAGRHLEATAWDEFTQRFQELTDEEIGRMAARWPDELDRAPIGPIGWKNDCIRFLAKRRGCVAYLLQEVRRVLAKR